MPIKKIIGIILLANAVFVAFEIALNLDSLRQSVEAFAAPEDPFWFYWGLVGFNCLMALASGVLGVYFLQAKLLKLRYTLPLSLITVLFGGQSFVVGTVAIGASIFQRYRPGAI